MEFMRLMWVALKTEPWMFWPVLALMAMFAAFIIVPPLVVKKWGWGGLAALFTLLWLGNHHHDD